LRIFFLAVVFACCAGLPGHTDPPGEDRPPPNTAASPATDASRPTCARYFGCRPWPRAVANPIEE
jgi:hypothetical protein